MNATTDPGQGPLVYIVDEDESYTRMLGILLRMEGYRMAVHSDPATAADAIARDRPALAVVDLHLGTTALGWEVVEGLRAREETKRLPVILCSGDLPALEEHSGWLAANDCTALPKPFDTDRFLAEVRRLVETDDG